jgi:hypothetical protein
MRMKGNLLNGITPRERFVTNDDAASPRPMLINGQPRTSGGSGSVPGCPSLHPRARARSFTCDESRSHRVSR